MSIKKIPKFVEKESIEERIRTLHSVWNTLDTLRSILSTNPFTATQIYDIMIELANSKSMFELVVSTTTIDALRTYYSDYEQHFKDCIAAMGELITEMDGFLETFRTVDGFTIAQPLEQADIDALVAILDKYL